MPDQTLQIDVKTTADLSGLQAVGAEVSKINSDIAAQLAASGAYFDPLSNSFKSITQKIQQGRRSAPPKASATWGIFAGAQLNKAKGEATVLARELATGSVNARTLGALFGSFGTNLMFLGIGAIVLGKGIYEVLQNADKLQQEVDKISSGFERAKLQPRRHGGRAASIFPNSSRRRRCAEQGSPRISAEAGSVQERDS